MYLIQCILGENWGISTMYYTESDISGKCTEIDWTNSYTAINFVAMFQLVYAILFIGLKKLDQCHWNSYVFCVNET